MLGRKLLKWFPNIKKRSIDFSKPECSSNKQDLKAHQNPSIYSTIRRYNELGSEADCQRIRRPSVFQDKKLQKRKLENQDENEENLLPLLQEAANLLKRPIILISLTKFSNGNSWMLDIVDVYNSQSDRVWAMDDAKPIGKDGMKQKLKFLQGTFIPGAHAAGMGIILLWNTRHQVLPLLCRLGRLDRLDRMDLVSRLDRLGHLGRTTRLDRLDRLGLMRPLRRLARLDWRDQESLQGRMNRLGLLDKLNRLYSAMKSFLYTCKEATSWSKILK
ncbi:unnamed protein product [Darwinula stevensoni]|uniref:Uncharacterized protein n=1 Tax=Darwinula stevensoni TaxID=69355 RepID=A0A7R8X7L8_9CRUS|nr:unnamed protein product [Darwinula stevensoni]CAG0887866.1 unnamed protein product [Darwinula stevensoni]